MSVPVLWTGGSLGSLLTSSRLNDSFPTIKNKLKRRLAPVLAEKNVRGCRIALSILTV